MACHGRNGHERLQRTLRGNPTEALFRGTCFERRLLAAQEAFACTRTAVSCIVLPRKRRPNLGCQRFYQSLLRAGTGAVDPIRIEKKLVEEGRMSLGGKAKDEHVQVLLIRSKEPS